MIYILSTINKDCRQIIDEARDPSFSCYLTNGKEKKQETDAQLF